MSDSSRCTVAQWESGAGSVADDRVAAEMPVALSYNRQAHVVMMATPSDLEDFGLGFSLTEGIIGQPGDLLAARVLTRERGLELAMTISEDCHARLAARRRNMTGRTGCGLCGAESLEQAIRDPGPVPSGLRVTHGALQAAVLELHSHQPLQARTGAVHGAAWCDRQGRIVALREDVGRHNALDKLIGALARSGFAAGGGFALVSSRASYEMVQKAAAAGVQLLVAVSAPTSLAIAQAQRSGLSLVGFARPGRHNIYTFPDRIGDLQD